MSNLPTISSEKRIMLITDSIKGIKRLINSGINILLVNLSSLAIEPGQRYITSSLIMNEDDFDMLKQLIIKGIQIDSRVNSEGESNNSFL